MTTSTPRTLPRWLSTAGKYVLTVLIMVVSLAVIASDADTTGGPATSDDAKIVLDLVVGLLTFTLIPLRRRFPVAVAVTCSLALAVSSTAFGPWAFATVSLARRRRVWASLALFVPTTAAGVLATFWMPSPEDEPIWQIALVSALCCGFATAVGFYLGARDALVASLHARAETAEREQASRAAQARTAERARIAREMHDVLAHRISTVAMHAGALAYRTDLSPEEIRDSAILIRDHADSALEELRGILGVLRADDTDGSPERPQPTIADLGLLVDDAAATGVEVHLDLQVDPADVPTTIGRHVFRSVQECITNARKHAPGSPVDVSVRHVEHDLVVTATNALPAPGSELLGHRPPSSGMGLLGLSERAELSGGHLEHGPQGDRYVTRLTIPWPERTPE